MKHEREQNSTYTHNMRTDNIKFANHPLRLAALLQHPHTPPKLAGLFVLHDVVCLFVWWWAVKETIRKGRDPIALSASKVCFRLCRPTLRFQTGHRPGNLPSAAHQHYSVPGRGAADFFWSQLAVAPDQTRHIVKQLIIKCSFEIK